jgi:uncharacterized protein YqgC (DUF456 family)
MQVRKSPDVKQLSNTLVNYAAFASSPLVPTTLLFFASLSQFVWRGQDLLSAHRLIAIATGAIWGAILAWAKNVPQVLYFYRPGGKNKAQRRLFVASVLGIFVSLSSILVLGVVQVTPTEDGPVFTYVLASSAVLGLLPIAIGCAKTWRYIYITDPRGVYIAYTGQALQPNTLYRTGLSWRSPAVEHHLEFEENRICQIKFKDGPFELRFEAKVNFPETPEAPEECKMDTRALHEAASEFLFEQLQKQCAKYTGMQCMKLQPGFKPVEEYVPVPAIEPEGFLIPVRMRWSGKFKLSDIQ